MLLKKALNFSPKERFAVVAALICAVGISQSGQASATPIWQNGDLISYNQASWTTSLSGSAALANNYFSVYQSSFGIVKIGIPGNAGYSIQFTSPTVISSFIPTNGPASTLTGDLLDPTTTPAGEFGGDVLALQLDIDFGDFGALTGSTGLSLGDLLVHDLSGATAGLNGLSVRAIDAIVNTALGGGSTGYAISDLAVVTLELGNSFDGGTVSMWAEDHLAAPSTVATVPEPPSKLLLAFGLLGLALIRRPRAYGTGGKSAVAL